MQFSDYLATAIEAAQHAGDFIQQKSLNKAELNVEQKSLNDFVSEVDKGAETIIRDIIGKAYPDHSFLGEEFGGDSIASIPLNIKGDAQETVYQWIVDPLDGTTNFLRGIPHYAVSIALCINGLLTVGVVFDPYKNELFSAIVEQGAHLNGQPIQCAECPSLNGALLSTGVPFSGQRLDDISHFTDALVGLLERQTSGVRRLGAAALDLAYVAAGRYDGFWEAGLQPWDIAAGALIAQEAGATVTDFSAAARFLESGNVVAASCDVFAEMQGIVERAYGC